MRHFFPNLGLLLFLGIGVNHALHYGQRWTFGRYYMPKSLRAPDGTTFADGTPLDALTRSLAQAGIEEEVALVLTFACAAGLVWLIWEMIALGRSRRKLRTLLEAEARERGH